jgi:hypothetical protein
LTNYYCGADNVCKKLHISTREGRRNTNFRPEHKFSERIGASRRVSPRSKAFSDTLKTRALPETC